MVMDVCRMASARAKAEQAQQAAVKAQSDADKGRQKAYSYDPNFVQPGACLSAPPCRLLPVLVLILLMTGSWSLCK